MMSAYFNVVVIMAQIFFFVITLHRDILVIGSGKTKKIMLLEAKKITLFCVFSTATNEGEENVFVRSFAAKI